MKRGGRCLTGRGDQVLQSRRVLYAAVITVASCLGMRLLNRVQASTRPPQPVNLFLEKREESGIGFRHQNGATGQKELPETFASGVALLDYDNDGLLDIYLVNGATLPGLRKEGPEYFNRLYHNDGDFRFSDVTLAAGVQGQGYGMGAAAADYDNDGNVDLYVTNYGPNHLYRNRGDGTFEDVAAKAGVTGGGWSTSAAFLDYDRDGDLDLYVCRYVVYEIGKKPRCGDTHRGLLSYCLPDLFEPMTHLFYRNNGDGTFKDVSQESGVSAVKGRGLGVTVGDYDNDGWIDIFVANDRCRNFLFHNQRDGSFEEVGLMAGVAYSMEGVARAGMGTDFGDYDQDGWLDIFVNNFETEGAALFRNLEGQFFSDIGGEVGLNEPSYPYVLFGGRFVDLDNDGLLDILGVSGHTQDDIEHYKPDITYPEPKLLFRNLGGRFALLRDGPDGVLSRKKVSRGAAFGDLDNDGAIDVVVNNTNDYAEILHNEMGQGNNSLLLKLVGSQSNRDGIGTRLEVRSGGRSRILEAKGAASYLAANDLRVHVGLGRASRVDELTLYWPSGEIQKLRDLPAGHLHVIQEGRQEVSSVRFGTRVPPRQQPRGKRLLR